MPHIETVVETALYAENLDEIETFYGEVLGLVVAIEKEVVWPLGGRSIYFRDPAGNSVELVTPGVWGTAAGWWYCPLYRPK